MAADEIVTVRSEFFICYAHLFSNVKPESQSSLRGWLSKHNQDSYHSAYVFEMQDNILWLRIDSLLTLKCNKANLAQQQ